MSTPDDSRDPWPPGDPRAHQDTEQQDTEHQGTEHQGTEHQGTEHHTEHQDTGHQDTEHHAEPHRDQPRAAAGPGPGSYGAGPWQAPYGSLPHQQAGSMSPDSERNWAVASHLTGFIAAYAALGFLGPLVCMLLIGDRSPFARRHAVEALNFNLTWLIYIVAGWVLTLVLVGWVLLAALGIGYLVLVVRGAMAASRGEEYRYPLTLRFVS